MLCSFSNFGLQLSERLFSHLLSLEELVDDSLNGILYSFISFGEILKELSNDHLPEMLSLLYGFSLLDGRLDITALLDLRLRFDLSVLGVVHSVILIREINRWTLPIWGTMRNRRCEPTQGLECRW